VALSHIIEAITHPLISSMSTITTIKRVNSRTITALQKDFDASTKMRCVEVVRMGDRKLRVIPDVPERAGYALHFACGWLAARKF
jgi:hypothetical protein